MLKGFQDALKEMNGKQSISLRRSSAVIKEG